MNQIICNIIRQLYLYETMMQKDVGISKQPKQQKKKNVSDHHAMVITTKNSIGHILTIYKTLKLRPKPFKEQSPQTLLTYSQYLQKLLSDLSEDIHKVCVPKLTYEKLQTQSSKMRYQTQQLNDQNKNYKIQNAILQQKLAELQQSFMRSKQQNIRLKQIKQQLDEKMVQIKRASQEGMKKILESGKEGLKRNERKHSLPVLSTHIKKRQKLSMLFLMDGMNKKNEILVDHLIKKY